VLVEASSTLLGTMQLADVHAAVLDLASRLISADAYAVWRKQRRVTPGVSFPPSGYQRHFRATR
jgi:hypothetical protein